MTYGKFFIFYFILNLVYFYEIILSTYLYSYNNFFPKANINKYVPEKDALISLFILSLKTGVWRRQDFQNVKEIGKSSTWHTIVLLDKLSKHSFYCCLEINQRHTTIWEAFVYAPKTAEIRASGTSSVSLWHFHLYLLPVFPCLSLSSSWMAVLLRWTSHKNQELHCQLRLI